MVLLNSSLEPVFASMFDDEQHISRIKQLKPTIVNLNKQILIRLIKTLSNSLLSFFTSIRVDARISLSFHDSRHPPNKGQYLVSRMIKERIELV